MKVHVSFDLEVEDGVSPELIRDEIEMLIEGELIWKVSATKVEGPEVP